MRARRYLRCAFAVLVLVLGMTFLKFAEAETHCYEVGNCNICDFWDGETYQGYVKWCPRPSV